MSSRDILRMLCCARNVSVGYTQGLNYTAAVLSCAMSRRFGHLTYMNTHICNIIAI